MILAPIVLFVYNRIEHTKQTIEALQRNKLSKLSKLIIYSDAAKSEKDVNAVEKVREYIKKVDGFDSVCIVYQEKNQGLARSIIQGVTEVVNEFGKIIVLEDDLVTSPYFLEFMNDSLTFYEKENRVISVHGYMYPIKEKLPETFFLRGAQCWGWGTWKRGWDVFNPNAHELLKQLEEHDLKYRFDRNGTYPFYQMLKDQANGKINSWAIRWQASAFLQEKLTLYPGKSLVKNIGFDGSGVHCDSDSYIFDVQLENNPIKVASIDVIESNHAHNLLENYYKSISVGIRARIKGRLKRILNF